jgi:hypothetical protein
MAETFSVPTEYQEAYRRLLPYMSPALRENEAMLRSVLLYLKLGNEKLARIVIEAFNENQRLTELEYRRRLRDEALLRENAEHEEDEETGYDDEDQEDQEDQEEESI